MYEHVYWYPIIFIFPLVFLESTFPEILHYLSVSFQFGLPALPTDHLEIFCVTLAINPSVIVFHLPQ